MNLLSNKFLSDVGNPGKGGFGGGDNPFGKIEPPVGIDKYGDLTSGGLFKFINNIILILIIGAGLYALINLVLAGYAFISAGDDSKKIGGAWSKIWQTLLGLAVAAGAFVLAGIFGKLIFDDPTALLKLKIFTP